MSPLNLKLFRRACNNVFESKVKIICFPPFVSKQNTYLLRVNIYILIWLFILTFLVKPNYTYVFILYPMKFHYWKCGGLRVLDTCTVIYFWDFHSKIIWKLWYLFCNLYDPTNYYIHSSFKKIWNQQRVKNCQKLPEIAQAVKSRNVKKHENYVCKFWLLLCFWKHVKIFQV